MAGEMRIADVIADIKRGDMILPEFQRGYVWTRDQVRRSLGRQGGNRLDRAALVEGCVICGLLPHG